MRRFSPLIAVAVAAAAALLIFRQNGEAETAEEWTPVRPS